MNFRTFNIWTIFLILACSLLGGIISSSAFASAIPPSVIKVKHPEALPLALDPSFQFRKTKTFFLETANLNTSKHLDESEKAIGSERKRLLFGAITPSEERERYGNYYSFFWRTLHRSNLKIRFEYRQANLGSKILAEEIDYPNAQGSHQSNFQIIGKKYIKDGRVTAWRAILIEYNNRQFPSKNSHIVALTQSYLWR